MSSLRLLTRPVLLVFGVLLLALLLNYPPAWAQTDETIVYWRGVRLEHPRVVLRGTEVYISDHLAFKGVDHSIRRNPETMSPLARILDVAVDVAYKALQDGKEPSQIRWRFIVSFEQEKKKLEAQGIEVPYLLDPFSNAEPSILTLISLEPRRLGEKETISLQLRPGPPPPTPSEQAQFRYREYQDQLIQPGLHLWGHGYMSYWHLDDCGRAVLETIRGLKEDRVEADPMPSWNDSTCFAHDPEGRIMYFSVPVPHPGCRGLGGDFVTDLMYAIKDGQDESAEPED